jgi:polar amino acid transport system substrate-binding protein
MSRLASHIRLPLLVTSLAVAALVATACGSSSSSSSSTGGSSSASTGGGGKTYIVATSADFPPMSSRSASNPNDIVGFEPDMIKAVMAHLGWKYKYVTSDFNGLIPSVQSGRSDLVASDIYDTSARRKIVDFIDYLSNQFAILVPSANAAKVKSFTDLCGKAIGVLTGSAPELQAAQAASKHCTSAGKPAIKIRSFPAVAQELPALANGTLDAMLETNVTEAYIGKQTHGKYKLVFNVPGNVVNVGMVLAKNSSIESKLRSGVQWFLSSPQYKADAAKWGLPTVTLITHS